MLPVDLLWLKFTENASYIVLCMWKAVTDIRVGITNICKSLFFGPEEKLWADPITWNVLRLQ